ncbi:MAG: hypothetical protein PUB13_02520 [Lachnospiraceae bacterium]|nr:hypothetical protein [Lachnospiraceae bacterium]
MKLRYYLRGLGIGILVTAALFLSMKDSAKPMTDAQVIARAKELGMIENPVLSDLEIESESDEQEETITESSVPQETVPETTETEAESTAEEPTEAELTEAESTEPSQAEEMAQADEKSQVEEPITQELQEGNTVIIVVNKGDGSDTVSRKLYEAGLVEDAKTFDRYLMQNGYDRKIAAGSHEIPVNASDKEIAEILCRR